MLACADVLGDEGSHGLHQGAGDQHGEIDDLAGHAVAGGSLQTQAVDKGTESQKRELGQKLLQRQRQADGQKLFALEVQPEVRLFDGKGQIFFQQHDNSADHADSLCGHGGNGGTDSIQMEPGHQDQVADDVDHAGHQHKDQGRSAVAQAAEEGREHIVGYDEEDACTADAHIAGGQVKGLGRGLHQAGNGPCQKHQNPEQHSGQKGEYNRRAADDRADEFVFLFAEIPRDQHCDTHGQLGDHKGDKVEHLAAGGNGRQARGGAEAAHHQQVYRAVSGLQHQCAQNGQHEQSQLFQDAALREIGLIIFQGNLSFRP